MKAQPLFPVVLKSDGFTPPDAPTYFVIAGNGFFLERRTELYAASVPVDGGVPGLESHGARLELRLPRLLPRGLIEMALGYFRAVFQRWRGEAILILFYAPTDGRRPARYRFVAPPQRIHGRTEWGRFRAKMRLDYGHCERPGEAWRKLGTMHSHGNFSARQSATDEHDEDGVLISDEFTDPHKRQAIHEKRMRKMDGVLPLLPPPRASPSLLPHFPTTKPRASLASPGSRVPFSTAAGFRMPAAAAQEDQCPHGTEKRGSRLGNGRETDRLNLGHGEQAVIDAHIIQIAGKAVGIESVGAEESGGGRTE